MKCNCWERIILNTPGLNCCGHIFLTKSINSFVQEECSDSEANEEDNCPNDSSGSVINVTDVWEPVN